MLRSLCEIQKLAYQLSSDSTKKDVLHFHAMAYVFATNYTQTFRSPERNSVRKMFGCPYHSVTKHMPNLFRIVSLRSVVAEAAERMFSALRLVNYKN